MSDAVEPRTHVIEIKKGIDYEKFNYRNYLLAVFWNGDGTGDTYTKGENDRYQKGEGPYWSLPSSGGGRIHGCL